MIIADTYTWPDGPEIPLDVDGTKSSLNDIKDILSDFWSLEEEKELVFVHAKSERLALLGNAHVGIWKKKEQVLE